MAETRAQAQTGSAARGPGEASAAEGAQKKGRSPERYAVVFQDECEFHLNPGLSQQWSRVGEQPVVPSAGHNRRVPVFGGLDASTGVLTLHLAQGKRTADFVAFLKLLLARYAGRHVFLFLDNCSIHSARAAQRFFADHRSAITPIWNAPYTPELNLIERYWGHLKAKAIHNYYFETVENLETAIRQAVTAMNRSRSLRLHLSLNDLRSLRRTA